MPERSSSSAAARTAAACYSGRWPHIHFEVYPSLADGYDQQLAATTGDATRGYEASLTVPV